LAAWGAAALRFGAPSLASTAETWWSTVLAEMNSFAAIAALVCPAQISDDQAPVAAPGLGRVAGQHGQRRLPLQQLHAYSVGYRRSMCRCGRPSR